MKSFKGLLASALMFMVTISCSGASENSSNSGAAESLKSNSAVTYTSNYPQVYVRGTFNNWETKAMTLVADNYWETEITFGNTSTERFKFDVYGDWTLNFGDNNNDLQADQNGNDIKVEAGKTFIINFNDGDKYYYMREKTYQADCLITFPAGVDAYKIAANKLRLYKGDADQGSAYIYTEDNGAKVYSPLSSLLKGTYTVKYDGIVDGKRYIGNTSFSIDGASDVINISMTLTEGPIDNYGTLNLTIYVDSYENNALKSSPWSGVGIYRGEWQAGNSIGTTNANGNLTTLLPEGAAQVFGVFIMTGSHSIFSNSITLDIAAGKITKKDVHYAPINMYITARYNTGTGYALYITGATDYLGNWSTATKMTYDSAKNAWVYNNKLPVHLPFKIVKAQWVDGSTISTSQAEWESGSNHECFSNQYVGYDGYGIDFTPIF